MSKFLSDGLAKTCGVCHSNGGSDYHEEISQKPAPFLDSLPGLLYCTLLGLQGLQQTQKLLNRDLI
jgi:hypothetical protein